MDIKQIREDFPLLKSGFKDRPIIYFDNACQTLRPNSVIKKVNDYYQKYPACAGRSQHKLGEKVTENYEKAREIIAKFLGADKKQEIIFTRNTTEGINLIAHSLNFKKGDIVLTTDKEHNSNLIPWQILRKKKGIVHKIIFSEKDNTFNLEKFKEAMSEKVKLVSAVYTSNLDGATFPVKEIIKIAHQYKALVLLDAAQSAPHQEINVKNLGCDFLSFSGHKMLGPSGTGILYGKYSLLEKLEPFLTGGDTVSFSTYKAHELLPLPEKFEAGLQNYAGIIGLAEAVKYLQKIGFDNIKKQEYKLNSFITKKLAKFSKVKIIGPSNPILRGGIISFYIKGIDVHQTALMLEETANIMVRAGQHCVHSWFNKHKIKGSVRASLYFYNTMEEAEVFIQSLKKIIRLV